MPIWQLQEAKSRFSEVVDLSLREGPQIVTRRGEEAVVVVSVKEFRRLTGQTPRLIECLLGAPRGESLKINRPPEAIRDLVL
jgi:prevent-host-death family protein